MSHPIDSGFRILIDPPVASNGGTAVDVGPAGLAKSKVYAAGLFLRNKGAVTHTVQLLSKGSGAAKVLAEFDMAATPCSAIIDGRAGRYETDAGEKLQIKFTDGLGAVGDIVISGSVIQKP